MDYQVKNSIIFSMEPQEIVLSALRTQDMDYESFRDEIDIMLKIIRERAAGECEILLPAFFKVSECNDVRKVEVCESTVVFNIEQRILQQESALPTIKQQDFSRFVDENINTATQELGTSICNLALKDHTRPAFLTTDGYLVILCSDVVLKDFVPCAEEKSHMYWCLTCLQIQYNSLMILLHKIKYPFANIRSQPVASCAARTSRRRAGFHSPPFFTYYTIF